MPLKILIVILIIFASLNLIGLIVFFVLRNKIIKLKNNCLESFDVLKDCFYHKNSILDDGITKYLSQLKEQTKVNSIMNELQNYEIDKQIMTSKEYLFNTNRIEKKEKVIYFVVENSSIKTDESITDKLQVLTSLNKQIKLAEYYYDYFVSEYEKKQKSFPFRLISKMCKFEKFDYIS